MGIDQAGTARRFARTGPAAVAAAVLALGLAGAGPAGAVTAGIIKTVAGGVGGPAKATTVAVRPCGVTFGRGNVYLGDIVAIRQVSPVTGQLTTPAGMGSTRPLGDAGPATRAGLNGACTAVLDGAGNLVITDGFDNRIRAVAARTGRFYGKQMTAGHIYTVTGTGVFGFSGDGGPASKAALRSPRAVAVDAAGNLVIADTRNNRIRVVAATTGTFYGIAMTAGDIYTVAGGGALLGDGGPASRAQLSMPESVTLDSRRNLVIADGFHNRVRVVAAATGTFYGQPMTAGDIYTVAGDGTPGFSGDGGPATGAALNTPAAVATDGTGNLVIADTLNNRIRVAAAATGTFYGIAMKAGDIYTVAGNGTAGFSGNGSPAVSAELNQPEGVAADGAGNLVIADSLNSRARVVAASHGTFYGKAMTAGDIYTVAGNGTIDFSGDGGPAAAAQIQGPEGVVVDRAGNLVVADTANNRIRVRAAATGTFYGQPMTAGDIYTVAGDGTNGFGGDGGPATSARLSTPSGITADRAGNLLVADTGNNRARMAAAKTGTFYGIATTAGHIYTVAGDGKPGFSGDGGPAAAARLDRPKGAAVDGAGNLVAADTANNRIRVVAASGGTFYGQRMRAGYIYTVAGTGTAGFSGDGGRSTGAELSGPAGVAVDRAGNLVIADTGNNRVRVAAAAAGTFYGIAMTAGHIYTVAGDGVNGFSGDGGPATAAALGTPDGVAADAAGGLVVADQVTGRIRQVTG